MSFPVQKATCNCGKVELEIRGTTIVTTVCHCSSCRTAGHILERLPNAPGFLDAEGGTSFALHRKDQVECIKGCNLLREHRLSASTATRRVAAICCNSFMFLDVTNGHWITVLRDRIENGHSPVTERERHRQSPFFFARLMIAWAKMGFRTPKIDFVKGTLENARSGKD
jgi:hypothetical protein